MLAIQWLPSRANTAIESVRQEVVDVGATALAQLIQFADSFCGRRIAKGEYVSCRECSYEPVWCKVSKPLRPESVEESEACLEVAAHEDSVDVSICAYLDLALGQRCKVSNRCRMQFFCIDICLPQVPALYVGKRFTFIDEIGSKQAFAENANDRAVFRSEFKRRLPPHQVLRFLDTPRP